MFQSIELLLDESHLTEIHLYLLEYIQETLSNGPDQQLFLTSGNLMFRGSDKLDNSLLYTHQYQLILSLSLSSGLQLPIKIINIVSEVYPDMCGNKRGIEALIQIN